MITYISSTVMFIQLTLMSESKPFHIRHDGFSDQNISDGSK